MTIKNTVTVYTKSHKKSIFFSVMVRIFIQTVRDTIPAQPVDLEKFLRLKGKFGIDRAGLSVYNSRVACGPVVQLVRTPACHAGGRGFEPLPGRHCFLLLWLSRQSTSLVRTRSPVRIRLAAPHRSKLRCIQKSQPLAGIFSYVSLLLLFREKARLLRQKFAAHSARLCLKSRFRNGSFFDFNFIRIAL